MIKLKTLLNEEKELSPEELANIIKNAYISIFDIDAVTITHAARSGAPDYCHSYLVVNVSLKYKFTKFFVYHKLYHFKFPKEELSGLSHDEYMAALAKANEFPYQPLTLDIIKDRSPLIRFTAGVFEDNNPEDKKFNYFELSNLGEVREARNILELITKVKKIIDTHGDIGGDDDKVPTRPILDPEHHDDLVHK